MAIPSLLPSTFVFLADESSRSLKQQTRHIGHLGLVRAAVCDWNFLTDPIDVVFFFYFLHESVVLARSPIKRARQRGDRQTDRQTERKRDRRKERERATYQFIHRWIPCSASQE